MTVSALISMVAQDSFQTYFADILSAMIYLLVPWSAINLADYYVVRKGKYDIGAMFHTDGVYGAYRWRTIGVFLLGIVVQEPFMSFTFYKGALAERIGADIAWLPGIVLPSVLYVLIERRALTIHLSTDVEKTAGDTSVLSKVRAPERGHTAQDAHD